MFGSLSGAPAQRAASLRVEQWVRERFRLAPDDTVLVTEVACGLPGCPPLETIVAFWTCRGDLRHHYKVFKPLQEVGLDDLPPWWMRDALGVSPDQATDCC